MTSNTAVKQPLAQTKGMATTVVNSKKIRRHSKMQVRTTAVKKEDKFLIKDAFIDADLSITPEVYAFLMAEQHAAGSDEIAGYAYADEGGEIIWASICNGGSMAEVEVASGDENWAMQECIALCGDTFNIQLHSHPSFDTYFSGTDESDIESYLKMSMQMSDSGEFYFVVYNLRSMIVRKVQWRGGKAYYNEGKVSLLGVDIPKSTSSTKTYGYDGTTYYTQGGGGSLYTYADDDEDWYFGGKTTVKKAEEEKSPNLITYHKRCGVEVGKLRSAFKSNSPLLPLLTGLNYFELREIKATFTKDDKETEIWTAIEEEMIEVLLSEDWADDVEYTAGLAKGSFKDGLIQSGLHRIDAQNYLVGELVIDALKSDAEVAEIMEGLDVDMGGVCFPSVLMIMADNQFEDPNPEHFREANSKVASSLPKELHAHWNEWIKFDRFKKGNGA